MFNSTDRKRLYKEAKSYMSLRHKRQKYVADYRAAGVDPALKEAGIEEPVLK